MAASWPAGPAALRREQERLAAEEPPPAVFGDDPRIGGCFVCFGRGGSGPGAAGDRGWSAAAVLGTGRLVDTARAVGVSGSPYRPGLLALREGPLLEAAVRGLDRLPDVLLVNATGRDHPRRAGLALHLGALLAVPTVGITHRPLVASGDWPGPERGGASPLLLGSELVGYWVRTRSGVRPVVAHAAWRTDPDTAARVVLATAGRVRAPEPLRQARRVARSARTAWEGRSGG